MKKYTQGLPAEANTIISRITSLVNCRGKHEQFYQLSKIKEALK
jgi:hypothetical protein